MFWTLWNVDAGKPAHRSHMDWPTANRMADALEALLGVSIVIRRA